MMRTLVLLSFLMFLSQAAFAGNPQVTTAAKRLPQLNDFSSRQSLLIEGNAAAYKLAVPAEIYAQSRQSGLLHIGIFNQAGNLVPWQIKVPQTQTRTTTKSVALRFFNGHQPLQVEPSTGRMAIYQGRDSAQINVELRPSFDALSTGAVQEPTVPNVYYVDLSEISNRNNLRNLEFQWDGDHPDDFSVDVKISGSTDFHRWQTLGSARLVSFTQDSATLKIYQVDVSMQSDPYLRIELFNQQAVPPLKALIGHFVSKELIETPERWGTAKLERLDDAPGYQFDTGGGYPIHRIGIFSSASNSLGEVSLYTLQNGRWVYITSARIVQLQHGDTTRNDTVIEVPRSRFRHWRLIFSKESTDYLTTVPLVKFGYRPDQLVFMRQGEGPFTLAYGVTPELQSVIDWPNWSHHLNFPSAEYQSDRVNPGEITLHTPEPLSLHPSKVPTSKPLFWSGITVFVTVLLGIALHLLREIRQ